ncbi:hypothetical protein RND71_026466 [Anisodus tanguticus]|uniref:Uncharacterized protein n=1 Tax=Anisodus tanguticus TaxID=243964 RepID=A0AAE1RNZ0_9SOLA|nr:hypothetical protein RND71_026466 [Anisodus tanguticus]
MEWDEVRDHVLAKLRCSYNEENIDECLDDQGDNGVKEFIDSVLQDVEIEIGEENFIECMDGDEVGDHVLALLGCSYNEENFEECLDDQGDNGVEEFINSVLQDDEIKIGEVNFIECMDGDEVRDHVLALLGRSYNEENFEECLDDQGDNGVKEFIDSILQDDEIATDDQGDNEVEEFIDSILQDDEIATGEENFIEYMEGDEVGDHVLALLGYFYNEENIEECLDDQGDNGVEEFIDSVLQDDEIAIDCLDDQGDNGVEEFIDSVLQDDEITISEENFIECTEGDEVRDHVLALFGYYYNEENIDECLDDQGDNGVKEFIDSVLQDDEITIGENIEECLDDRGDNGVKEFIDSILQDDEIAIGEENFIECMEGDEVERSFEEFIDSVLQDDEIATGEENFIECMEGDEVGDHVLALLGYFYNEENIEECLDDQGDNGVEEFIDSVLQDDEIATGEENFIECMEGDEVGDHVLALLGYFYNEENIEECLDDQGDNGVEEFIDSVLQDDEIAIGEENFIECMEGMKSEIMFLLCWVVIIMRRILKNAHMIRGIMESKNLLIPLDDEISISEENFIECTEGDEVRDHVLALFGCYYNEENIDECLDDQGDNGVKEFIDSVLQDDEITIGEENFIECMEWDEVRDHVLAKLRCSYNEENIDECLDDQGDNGVKEFIDSVLQDDEIATDDQGDNEVEEFIDSILQDDEIATGEENFIECMEGDEVGDHVLALLGYFYNEENIEECLDDQGDNGVKEFIDSVLQDDEIATGEENFIECMEGDEVGDHVLALLGYFYNEENIEECLDDQGDNGVEEFIDSVLQDDEIAIGEENFIECMEGMKSEIMFLLCWVVIIMRRILKNAHMIRGIMESKNLLIPLDDEISISEENFIECTEGDEVRDHVLALFGCYYNEENIDECLDDQGDNGVKEFIDSVLQDDEITIGEENFIECMEWDEVRDHVLAKLRCSYNEENIDECLDDQGDNGVKEFIDSVLQDDEIAIDDQGDNGVEEFIDSILQDDEIAIGEENFIECMEGDEVGDHVLALLGYFYNEENIEECLDDQGDNGVEEFIDSVLQDDEIAIGEENFIECMEGDEVGDHVLALLGYFYNEENIEECLDDRGIMESKNLSIPFYKMMK